MKTQNKKQVKANSSKYKINENGTITINKTTYKLGTIKLLRLLMVVVAIMSLLLSPVFPVFLIVTLFFAFMSYNYTKMIKDAKAPASTNNSFSESVSTSSEEESVLNVDSLFEPQNNIDKKTTVHTKSNNLTFNVAGVTMKNDMNKDIKGIIKKIVKDIKEYKDNDDLYEGKSNSEIKEELEYNSEDVIYELEYETIDDIKLIPEPSNPYDSNAIKVVSEEYGHLGYVPKDMTKKVSSKMNNGECSVECTIVGGKYKYYDEDEEKVLIDSYDYGLTIDLS